MRPATPRAWRCLLAASRHVTADQSSRSVPFTDAPPVVDEVLRVLDHATR